MKRSLKALLAIAASSATTLALATPSYSVTIGGYDEEVFTGIYQAELESSRSCTITTIGAKGQGGLLDDAVNNGTAIALKRVPGQKDAVGAIAIEFEAIGANMVYFEEDTFQVGSLDGDGGTEENGEGNITVTLDEAEELLNREARGELVDQLQQQGVDDYTQKKREIAVISDKKNEGGYILGGQGRNESKSANQVDGLEELTRIFGRAETRQAAISMRIKDVDELGSSAIQARLVCAPVLVEVNDGSATIRPITNN